MMFGSQNLWLHLARGVAGFSALVASLAIINQVWWPSMVLMPLALWMFKGCPVCWTVGLAETLAHKVLGRVDAKAAEGVRQVMLSVIPKKH